MKTVAVLVAVILLTGCATLFHGTDGESVMINDQGCPVGTQCVLTNKKGSWIVEPPGFLSVPKSDDALKIKCVTPSGQRIHGALDSEVTGTIFGNIILGGGLGALVDAHTDAHRKYADSITIRCR